MPLMFTKNDHGATFSFSMDIQWKIRQYFTNSRYGPETSELQQQQLWP